MNLSRIETTVYPKQEMAMQLAVVREFSNTIVCVELAKDSATGF
jgi:hypothetical protein